MTGIRLASLFLVGLLGCAHAGAPTSPQEGPAASRHGYALLHEILGQERRVSLLLLIKAERKALETVIDAIAETCDTAYDRLEDLAAEQPRLDLSDTGLPADEVLTREAIARTRRDQLLAASGREFELQLLWSQNEALTYASHLADTLARSESDPARLAFVRALWKDLTRLDEDVRALLRGSPRSGASTDSPSPVQSMASSSAAHRATLTTRRRGSTTR